VKPPPQTDRSLQYLLLDEAKHCTFRPRTRGSKDEKHGHHDSDAKEAKSSYGFIERQEAKERSRRDDLEFRMGKVRT
jgi:hypothetical protein